MFTTKADNSAVAREGLELWEGFLLKQKFGFIKRIDKGWITAVKDLEKISKSFTVVIQPLSTRLLKPNFCFDLPHRRNTTVSLETRNPFFPKR